MTENTARFTKNLDWRGDARLFELSYPVNYGEGKTNFVAVSAVDDIYSGPETYIFPTKEDGEVLDWCELNGSYRGGLDHKQALNDAGYEVKEMKND